MTTRAIWQAKLKIKKHEMPVKLYSAVEDRQIHFHLLHKRDHTRVEQQMVDSQTGEPVASSETFKAFEAEPGLFVKLWPEEIERSVPSAGRDLSINRFVPLSAIEPFLYDRPYYVGPGTDATADYFALVHALEKKQKAGIAHWVMRKHSYRGALVSYHGYLALITLRRADEVVPLDQLDSPVGPAHSTKETDLAGRLLEELSGTFRAGDYHDEYQVRVRELIDAKRSGKKIRRKRLQRRAPTKSLADSLEKSLRSVRPQRRH